MTRIALVGAGRMGRVHLAALARLAGVEVAAVVDPVAPDATHGDVAALLADRPPDGAIVAAPSTLHLDLVTQLLGAGVPVLCEKPCGTSAAEAARAFEAAAASGTPLQIGYWRRFVPALRELRERILGGALGDVLLVRCEQWDREPPPAAFRRTSGGILVDMGVHELDQARWLTGQELAFRGLAAGAEVDGDPDSVEALYELSGGGVLAVSLGRRHPPGDVCRVEVRGSNGVERIEFLGPPDPDAAFTESIAAEDAAFVALVRGGAQEGASADDAVAALAAAEAASAW